MEAYFLDTSALVKRYIKEPGSSWLRSALKNRRKRPTYVAMLAEVEFVAAIARRQRGGDITAAKSAEIIRQFGQHWATQHTVIAWTESISREAIGLAQRFALRANDAIQLASVLVVHRFRGEVSLPAIILLSSDLELNDAARALGIVVQDPATASV